MLEEWIVDPYTNYCFVLTDRTFTTIKDVVQSFFDAFQLLVVDHVW